MSEQLSNRDIRAIEDYVTGGNIPSGRICPKKLLRRLEKCIECLEEYVLFQTGGSSQQTFQKRLLEYRAIRSKLVGVMDWYNITENGTPEGEWMKEFHRIGMHN